MSTAAYILALTIGIFSIVMVSSSTADDTVTEAKAQPVVAVITDPLVKHKNAKVLTDTELVELLQAVGFEGKALKIAWATVMKESRGHPTSHNKTASTGDNSYGLFQINMIGSLGSDRRAKFGINSDAALLDPVANAKAAYYMTAQGTDWGSWGLGPNAYDGDPAEPSLTKWIPKFPSSKS
jgi:hypothetical protein